MYGVFFQSEALSSLKNAWLPRNFLFGYKGHLFCFLHIVLKHTKNIPVLVGTTHRKPKYLEMHRTYVLWFNFILGLNFVFLLFLGIVMYDNEFETMENKI